MKFGLIGEKLNHSFSKEVHNKIGNYDYALREISRDGLEDFFRSKDFLGLNVTIPYKEEVIKYLDDISPSAKKIGAVNTVVNKNGKLIGYNTDYDGAKLLIERNGVKLKGKNVYILGSGGASKTLNAVSIDLGAREVTIVSRKGEKGITYEKLYKKAEKVEVLINTTPVGTYLDAKNCPVELSKFSNLESVIDLIYNPLKTQLIMQAESKGIKAGGGLLMLVAQAVYAYSHFFDKQISGLTVDKIYSEILNEKQNVVLTGMPSCGKSTIGKILSEKLGKKFLDSDDEIVKKYKKTPKDIILSYGEEKFREIESEIIEELSYQTGLIIATGGGAIIKEENVKSLKRNGRIFYLKKDLENLISTESRPLTSSLKDLQKVYEKRKDIYIKTADKVINANYSAEEVADVIIKETK